MAARSPLQQREQAQSASPADGSSVRSGTAVTLTAAVTADSSPAPTGTVRFHVDGVNYGCLVTIASNKATISVTGLAVGSRKLSATYNRDTHCSVPGPVAVTVNVTSGSTVALAPTNSAQFACGSRAVVATVSGGATTIPTGTVQVLEGSTVRATGTLSGGKVALQLWALSSGTHKLVARYLGDNVHPSAVSPELAETILGGPCLSPRGRSTLRRYQERGEGPLERGKTETLPTFPWNIRAMDGLEAEGEAVGHSHIALKTVRAVGQLGGDVIGFEQAQAHAPGELQIDASAELQGETAGAAVDAVGRGEEAVEGMYFAHQRLPIDAELVAAGAAVMPGVAGSSHKGDLAQVHARLDGLGLLCVEIERESQISEAALEVEDSVDRAAGHDKALLGGVGDLGDLVGKGDAKIKSIWGCRLGCVAACRRSLSGGRHHGKAKGDNQHRTVAQHCFHLFLLPLTEPSV